MKKKYNSGIRIVIFLVITLKSIGTYADIKFNKPSCNNIFKDGGMAQYYFLTNKPKEMFYMLSQSGDELLKGESLDPWIADNFNTDGQKEWDEFKKENSEFLEIDENLTFCQAHIYIYNSITENDACELRKHIEKYKNPPFLIVNI